MKPGWLHWLIVLKWKGLHKKLSKYWRHKQIENAKPTNYPDFIRIFSRYYRTRELRTTWLTLFYRSVSSWRTLASVIWRTCYPMFQKVTLKRLAMDQILSSHYQKRTVLKMKLWEQNDLVARSLIYFAIAIDFRCHLHLSFLHITIISVANVVLGPFIINFFHSDPFRISRTDGSYGCPDSFDKRKK